MKKQVTLPETEEKTFVLPAEGEKKFQERRTMLKSRKINYSYDNGFTGKKRDFIFFHHLPKVFEHQPTVQI